MPARLFAAAVAIVLIAVSRPAVAQDLVGYLQGFFAGKAISFGYGGGTSSNNPRVEMIVHYCASGSYFTSGRSCRPNVVARGYQCTPFQDSGRWQVSAQGGQGLLQWVSNSGQPGNLALNVRNNGLVVDPRGNPFTQVGAAQCR